MEGFSSNLNDTFTSTRGCAEPMFFPQHILPLLPLYNAQWWGYESLTAIVLVHSKLCFEWKKVYSWMFLYIHEYWPWHVLNCGVMFYRNLQSDRNTIHKNLVLCLMIAEILFLFGIGQTENKVGVQVCVPALL